MRRAVKTPRFGGIVVREAMPLAIATLLTWGIALALAGRTQLPELPPDEPTPPVPEPTMPTPDPPELIEPAVTEPDPVLPPEMSAPEPVETVPHTDKPDSSAPLRDAIACPADLEILIPLLIRDIPTYANRVLQQALGEIPPALPDAPLFAAYRPAYVVIAGEPTQTPLDISSRVYTTSPADPEALEQVFFTTLERVYTQTELTEITHFHWLFLVPSDDGWQLAFMYSAIDSQDDAKPILPPQESSTGSVGRGVALWLRDCRAGAIEGY